MQFDRFIEINKSNWTLIFNMYDEKWRKIYSIRHIIIVIVIAFVFIDKNLQIHFQILLTYRVMHD